MVDELLPVLSCRLAQRADLAPVLEAATEGGIAFVDLDEGPSSDGPHALEIEVPGRREPVVLIAEVAGEPIGRTFPLLVRPFAGTAQDLAALAVDERAATEPAMEAPRPGRPAGDARLGRALGGGKYVIEELLGKGGMGCVYRARHVALQKAIALKVLHAPFQGDPVFVASFHREALAASRLDHPNVVRVLDFGEEPDGLLYITMELLAGTDLGTVLTREKTLPLQRIVDVMTQVCAALSASHEQGVVHRDIKPDNLLLVPSRDDDGTIREVCKVCDFGIAEIQGARAAPGGAPAGGRAYVSGTPDYMSPEQARAETPDARSDVYSCGVILYEMATGQVPFAAAKTPQAILEALVHRDPPRPREVAPGVDPRLEEVILRAMSKDPRARYPTARDLRAALRALVGSPSGVLGRPRPKIHSIPPEVAPVFERSDAIEVGDLLALEEDAPACVQEQAWVTGAQLATALAEDPEAVLRRIDGAADLAAYARHVASLERALALLAQRAEAAPLLAAAAHLEARAGASAPGDGSREALAARALASVRKADALAPLAERALEGAAAEREAARRALARMGAAGALALCAARERAGGHGRDGAEAGWAGRPRFVAAIRDLGAAATRALADALRRASPRDAALAEDLLRGMPDVPDAPAGEAVARFLRHESPAVRRAATGAIASLWGPSANPWLDPMLADPDEGVRLHVIAALRRTQGIDREALRHLAPLLDPGARAGDELRTAAAAALADATPAARPAAVEALCRALRPPQHGLLKKLVTVEVPESPLVILTMARVLRAIGGAEGARAIEARRAASRGDLEKQLAAVLAGRSA